MANIRNNTTTYTSPQAVPQHLRTGNYAAEVALRMVPATTLPLLRSRAEPNTIILYHPVYAANGVAWEGITLAQVDTEHPSYDFLAKSLGQVDDKITLQDKREALTKRNAVADAQQQILNAEEQALDERQHKLADAQLRIAAKKKLVEDAENIMANEEAANLGQEEAKALVEAAIAANTITSRGNNFYANGVKIATSRAAAAAWLAAQGSGVAEAVEINQEIVAEGAE